MKYNANEQTIGWFKDRYLEGTLEIRPPYQRRPVWAARQKSNLIESILLGLPVPEIYVHVSTTVEGKTTYAVVDGQQRIRTVLQFLGLDKDEAEQDENRFELTELAQDSPWRAATFEAMTADQKKTFYGYRLAVRNLDEATDDGVRDLFRRLNAYLTKLNDQELRNATYSGPFVSLVNTHADDSYWAENGIVTAALIRRMKDMEFVSDLLIGVMDGPQGGAASVIDDYYLALEQYSDEFPDQALVDKLYKETFSLIRELFPEIRGTRWRNRTDFYSLFVAISGLLRTSRLPPQNIEMFRQTLMQFAEQVSMRIADEDATVPQAVNSYVPAVQRGSSDRSRRATRHVALTETVRAFFLPKSIPAIPAPLLPHDGPGDAEEAQEAQSTPE